MYIKCTSVTIRPQEYQQMIREEEKKKKRERGGGGGKWKERLRDRKFHPPPPVIVNMRVEQVCRAFPSLHLHFLCPPKTEWSSASHAQTNKDWMLLYDHEFETNLPTSAVQNACWGCAGEQLQASAISSTRQRNRMARVTKQLFIVQVILQNLSVF